MEIPQHHRSPPDTLAITIELSLPNALGSVIVKVVAALLGFHPSALPAELSSKVTEK